MFIIILVLVQITVLGTIDYFTGFELSFSVFYLIPVAIAAWYAEKKTALFISGISAVVWQFSNQLAGESFQHIFIPIWNTSTRLGFFLVVVILLTKLKDSYLHQKSLARTDFLTGAANPRAFYEIVKMEILRSSRYKRSFTLCFLDADNFKIINDTMGHHIGSDLLIKVVEIIKQNLRGTDTIARLGGDEFAILLTETNLEQSQTAVRKFHEKLLDEMAKNNWEVTFSIGVLTFCTIPETVDEAIKNADSLMYEVKQSGKNAVKYKEFKKTQFAVN